MESSRVVIRQLPSFVGEKALRQHLERVYKEQTKDELLITDLCIVTRNEKSREFAFVGLMSVAMAAELKRVIHQTYLHTRKLLVESASVDSNQENYVPVKRVFKAGMESTRKVVKFNDDATEVHQTSGRLTLFIIGLPYKCTDANVCDFLGFTPVKIHFHSLDYKTMSHRGRAIIQFSTEEEALITFRRVQTEFVCGRKCQVEFAREESVRLTTDPKNFKEFRDQEAKAYDPKSNLLYHETREALENAMQQTSVSTEELRTRENASNIAALAEIDLKQKAVEWLKSLGLEQELFDSTEFAGKKSKDCIVIKNLPLGTDIGDLRRALEAFSYGSGQVSSLAERTSVLSLAPQGTLLLLKFKSAIDARRFREVCNFRKFRHSILLLEWATEAISTALGGSREEAVVAKDAEPQSNTVYLKNLNFETTSKSLTDRVESCDGFRSVSILKHEDGRSRGYGFVDFKTPSSAEQFLKKFSGGIEIDGHLVSVALSKVKPVEEDKVSEISEKAESQTVIIKNLPFNVTESDLKPLIDAIIEGYTLRLPKNSHGRPRGFAFVETLAIVDARKLILKLNGIHLMQRKMIVTYSS